MVLTFNTCKQCGHIRENASTKLQKLKKKLDEKRYQLEYGHFEEKMNAAPKAFDLWEWTQTLNEVLGEI